MAVCSFSCGCVCVLGPASIVSPAGEFRYYLQEFGIESHPSLEPHLHDLAIYTCVPPHPTTTTHTPHTHTHTHTHQVSFLFSDRGIPDGHRHMNGYGSHTFKLVNKDGQPIYCKFHFKVGPYIITTEGVVMTSAIDRYDTLASLV